MTVHESGLPIFLHEKLFRIPHYSAPVDEMWARAQTREVYGVKTRVFSPEDMLLHVCGHAACSASREHLTWVCDSWMILARNTTLDWRLFSEMAGRCNLDLPLAVLTRYLAQEMGAPIPDSVLVHLQQESTTADAADLEAALFGATAGSRGDLRGMVKGAKGWADRMILAKCASLSGTALHPVEISDPAPVAHSYLLLLAPDPRRPPLGPGAPPLSPP